MSLAVVTGAARGLGKAIATTLAADGHELLLVDRDGEVKTVAAGLGATSVVADLSTTEGIGKVIGEVDTRAGLDILVNNAGITRDARLVNLTEEDVRLVLRVNLGAAHSLATGLENLFVDGGSIVSISSRSYLGNFGQFNYSMSKAGLVGWTRAYAMRMAPRVRVNAVAPGFMDTAMTQAMPEEARQRVVDTIPMGRAGDAVEVAEVVSFLTSSRASYVTGQVLVVCGGRSIG